MTPNSIAAKSLSQRRETKLKIVEPEDHPPWYEVRSCRAWAEGSSILCNVSGNNLCGSYQLPPDLLGCGGKRVSRWRNASMALRWTAAGMLEAKKGFRRINACRQLPVLRAALLAHQAKHARSTDLDRPAKAA